MKRLALPILLALTLAACAPAAPGLLHVQDAWARPMPAGANGGAFFTIVNPEREPDRLLGASSDVAAAVEVHQTSMQDGVMQMAPQEFVDVPADGEVIFAPGGLHVMLIGLTRDLKEGETFWLTLHFERAGDLSVEVAVGDAP